MTLRPLGNAEGAPLTTASHTSSPSGAPAVHVAPASLAMVTGMSTCCISSVRVLPASRRSCTIHSRYALRHGLCTCARGQCQGATAKTRTRQVTDAEVGGELGGELEAGWEAG